jgi:glycosyltransferase involved in cell wall biosynthesis
MKIFHLVNHCRLANGNVSVAIDLACEQARRGDEPVVLSEGGYFTQLLADNGVSHIRLPHTARAPGEAARAIWSLTRLIREGAPDVLHAHMMSGSLIGFAAGRVTGTPMVTTVHNSFDGHSALMKLGDAVVAVSHAERDALLRRGFRPERVFVVYNGPLGSPRFAHSEPPPSSRKLAIMSLCGLHARKGVGDIIEAFAEVAAEFSDWSLVIGGEGPLKADLIGRAAALNLSHRISFPGQTENPIAFLAQGSIFVIASHAEPFGLATVEARRAGCAVVGTAVGGTPEVLDGGEAGLLVPPMAPPKIAQAFRALMSDPARLKTAQARAQKGLQKFTSAAMASGYGEIYQRLCAPHSVDLPMSSQGRAVRRA